MLKKIIELLKEAFMEIYKYRFRIIVGAVVLALICNIFHYNFNKSFATVKMSLNYSQASQGLNPNSTRFSIYEFTCNDVLERTIKAAGLTDKITPEELKDAITVVPDDKSDSENQDQYVCTTYSIKYTRPRQIRGIDSLNMLEIYCSAYKDYFIENHGDNSAILYYDSNAFNHVEPYLKLNDAELKAKQILRYVEQRITENTSYTDSKTGDSFLSVMKEINQIVEYDIPNIYGFIRESGISVDKADLLATLRYKNKILSTDHNIMIAHYEADNYGISLYDEAMSGIVLVPAVDVNNKYYMSRTETALDTMADAARESLELATEVQKEITDTSHTVTQMEAVETTEGNIDRAADMIVELDDRIDKISKKLQTLDASYINYKTHNYLTFKYTVANFLKCIDISATLIEVMIYLVVCYLAAVVITKRNKDKKEGEKA